ncbi:MAG: winged helix-turn-helix domain-containing protein [Candidatus Thorarchaeota archaeon]
MAKKSNAPPMKDLKVIEDAKTIKLLFEPTRANIVFKYLTKGTMTVKQLADALDKNPGTILHHIDKLKDAGLVVQDYTEPTNTGIVQRYYRATAREYRLGISGMMQTDGGVAEFAKERLRSMVKSLSVYGIDIPEDEIPNATEVLRRLIERENAVSSALSIVDETEYEDLSRSLRNDASRIMRRFALEEDSQYRERRRVWHEFLRKHKKNDVIDNE